MYKRLFVAAAMVVTVGSMVGLTGASAKQGGTDKYNNNEAKVIICHRTDAVNNPYVRISVSVNAANGEQHDDHSSHTGPVASSLSVATTLKQSHTKWGDIISAYPGYAGYNLAGGGQAILDNGCKYPARAASVEPATTASDSSCKPAKEDKPVVPAKPVKVKTPVHPATVETPAPSVVVPAEHTAVAAPAELPHTGTDTTRMIATALSLAVTAYTLTSIILKRAL
jgi:hypothetical protein